MSIRRRRANPVRWLSRRRRHLLAAGVTAMAAAAVGFALFGFGTWWACRSGDVQSYPKAYPNCVPSAQAAHLRLAGGALWALLVLAVLAVYLWIRARDTAAPPAGRAERGGRARRTPGARRETRRGPAAGETARGGTVASSRGPGSRQGGRPRRR